MSNKPPNIFKTQAIGVILLLTLTGVMYFFLLGPRLSAPSKINDSKAADLSKIASLGKQLIQLQGLKNSIPAANQRVTNLTNRFPPDTRGVSFEAEVTTAANSSGITSANITQINLSPTVLDSTQQSGSIPVEIDVTGSRDQIGTFVNKLYSIQRAMDVDTVSLAAVTVGKVVSQYTAKINGNIYILKPLTPLPASLLK